MTADKTTAGAGGRKRDKPSGPEQVAAYMRELEHPLKEEIAEVRRIVLASDGRLTETIKWNAPSFCVDGEDRITFQLQGKGFFRLIFHCGAKVRGAAGKERLYEDRTGLLEWASADRAIAKFTNMDDVRRKERQLRETVVRWIEAAGAVDGGV